MDSNASRESYVLERLSTNERVLLDKNEPSYTCGRSPKNNIVCVGNTVSRKHCIFLNTRDGLFVTDLGSSNGVFINGVRVSSNMTKVEEYSLVGIGCNLLFPSSRQQFVYRVRNPSKRSRVEKTEVEEDDVETAAKKAKIEVEDVTTDAITCATVSSSCYSEDPIDIISSSDDEGVDQINVIGNNNGIDDAPRVVANGSNPIAQDSVDKTTIRNTSKACTANAQNNIANVKVETSIPMESSDVHTNEKLVQDLLPTENLCDTDDELAIVFTKKNEISPKMRKKRFRNKNRNVPVNGKQNNVNNNFKKVPNNDANAAIKREKRVEEFPVVEASRREEEGSNERTKNIEVINLSDDERDDLPQSTELFGRTILPFLVIEPKKEIEEPDNEKEDDHESWFIEDDYDDDVIVLSDTDDVDERWYQRLSQSQEVSIKIKEEAPEIDENVSIEYEMYNHSDLATDIACNEDTMQVDHFQMFRNKDVPPQDEEMDQEDGNINASEKSVELFAEISTKDQDTANEPAIPVIESERNATSLMDKLESDHECMDTSVADDAMPDIQEEEKDKPVEEHRSRDASLPEKLESKGEKESREPHVSEKSKSKSHSKEEKKSKSHRRRSSSSRETKDSSKKDKSSSDKKRRSSTDKKRPESSERHSKHQERSKSSDKRPVVEREKVTPEKTRETESEHVREEKGEPKSSVNNTSIEKSSVPPKSKSDLIKHLSHQRASSGAKVKRVPEVIEAPFLPKGEGKGHSCVINRKDQEQDVKLSTKPKKSATSAKEPANVEINKEERKEKLKRLAEESKPLSTNPGILRKITKPKVKVSQVSRFDKLVADQIQETKKPLRRIEREELQNKAAQKIFIETVQRTKEIQKSMPSTSYCHNNSPGVPDTAEDNDSMGNSPLATDFGNSRNYSNRASSTRHPSIPQMVGREVEYRAPTALKKRANKRVRFSDNLTEVHEFEIDPGNSLKRIVGKDAPKPIWITKPSQCPKLDEFLYRIFQWNPDWLTEEIYDKELPPVIRKEEFVHVQTVYKSYEEYYKIMTPLLLLEIWTNIRGDYSSSIRLPMKCSIVTNSINFRSIGTGLYLSELMIQVLITEAELKKESYPVCGDLVALDVSYEKNGLPNVLKLFGYIYSLCPTLVHRHNDYNRELRNFVPNPHTLLTYNIFTRHLDTSMRIKSIHTLKFVQHLKPHLRCVMAVQNLPSTPLINSVLNPDVEDFKLPPISQKKLFRDDKLNPKQLEVVTKITECAANKEAKICLVQGPPGTGKSKVIVNLVIQTLYGDNRYQNKRSANKILLCAQSNLAVDELVIRLLKIRSTMKDHKFRMVRVGVMQSMLADVKSVSLSDLARKEIYHTRAQHSQESLDQEIVELQARINGLRNQIECITNPEHWRAMKLQRDLASHLAKYDLLTQYKMAGDIKDEKKLAMVQRAAEQRILLGADIIACTLSCSYSAQMEKLFGGKKELIPVCIVDEATQSCEPETLIPLLLGVKTLVLVGDPKQLPATVLSQKAKKLGLNQSLFARLEQVFDTEQINPVIMLDTQYRMAYPIAYWPNKYFYNGLLRNAAEIHTQQSNFPFKSYAVFNLDSHQDVNKFGNIQEAEFITNAIVAMLNHGNFDKWRDSMTLGILTAYQHQRNIIFKKLDEKMALISDAHKDKLCIDVNTIDAFQGQERDIVIISCTRSHGIGFLTDPQRLCVALTRAKQALFICGNFKTFGRNEMWKALLADAQSRGVFVHISGNAQLKDIRPHVVRDIH